MPTSLGNVYNMRKSLQPSLSGAIQVLRNADGGWGQIFREKALAITKVYGSMLLAVRGGGWPFLREKKRYVILEWPLTES